MLQIEQLVTVSICDKTTIFRVIYLVFHLYFIQFIINLTIPRRKNNSTLQLSPMEKDEIKIWGKSLKFASKTTKEFSVTVIHDPFFGFSGSALRKSLRSVALLLHCCRTPPAAAARSCSFRSRTEMSSMSANFSCWTPRFAGA